MTAVELVAPDERFRPAAFWRSGDGLVQHDIECRITVAGEGPPAHRESARD